MKNGYFIKLETLVIGETDSPSATNWIGLQSKVRFSNCNALAKTRALQFEWRNIVIHWQQYENQYLYAYLNLI
jgi:hypothetical protein